MHRPRATASSTCPRLPGACPAAPPAAGGASALTAQTVAVNAKWIDIDSQITAGRPTTYTITLDTQVQTFINAQTPGHGIVDVPTSAWCVSGGATCSPHLVQYDTDSGHIVVNNVNASGGGFVSLDGGIISTKAIGQITINDGYGHVTVNNNLTNVPVQMADINTGNNAVGELKITDHFKTYNVGGNSVYQTFWYVDTQGSGTKVYTNSNGATDVASAVQFTGFTTDSQGIQYDPTAGLRYQWQQQVNLSRPIPTLDTITNWQYVDASGTAVSTPQYLLISSGVTTSSTDHDAFDEHMTASASLGTVNNGQFLSAVDVYYHGCGDDLGSGCHYGFSKTDQAAGAGVWEYRYFEDAQINLTSSVKADYTFHINFQGNASGQVNINSASNVLLGGNIYNPTGSTSILATQGNGGSITGSASGGITSNGLTLKATGSVGDASNPLNVVMTGGKLSVDAGAAGTNIAATTALDLDHVTAGNATTGYGDVTLTSGGSITGGSGTAITGRDITLSAGGAIGGALNGGNPLVIAAHATTAADHSLDHGVVNLDALNDINVRQTGGDLLVGLIKSEGGSVNVDVPDGSIVDAAGITSGQALSTDQLKTVSETLHLTTADDNGAIAAATKQRIEQTADGYYTQYQGLMDNGQVVGGTFVLNTSKLDLYRSLAAAELGHAASDADVQAYAAGRYTTYDTYFKGLIGTDYATTAKFTTPVAAFNYVADDAQVQALTRRQRRHRRGHQAAHRADGRRLLHAVPGPDGQWPGGGRYVRA